MSKRSAYKNLMISLGFGLVLSACSGGSDSSGSNTAVGSDEDSRLTDASREAQAQIEQNLGQQRNEFSFRAERINDNQDNLSEDLRVVNLEDQVDDLLSNLTPDIVSSIAEIVDNSNSQLTLLSSLLYPYLFETHKDNLITIIFSEINELRDVSNQVKSISQQRAISRVLDHYCNLKAALESQNILIRAESLIDPQERDSDNELVLNALNSCDG